jgi:hypothetical protein
VKTICTAFQVAGGTNHKTRNVIRLLVAALPATAWLRKPTGKRSPLGSAPSVNLPYASATPAKAPRWLPWVAAVAILSGCDSRNGPIAQKITCVNNLKQIGLAFKTWALDNNGQFPWNVTTNEGGTMELCARAPDGFDTNAPFHFTVMSNELSTPLVLVCPQDLSRTPVRAFGKLRPENITYRLRSGTNITDATPKEVLAVCPIDANTLYCDASVKRTKPIQEKPDGRMQVP